MATTSRGAAHPVERPIMTASATMAPAAMLFPTPPRPSCTVSVVIPAKDEREGIEATLDALAGQVELDGCSFPRERFEILVLANNCRDETAAIVRRFARHHLSLALHVAELRLPPPEAHVGRARRLLMDAAYHRLASLSPTGGVIASTDGDTLVAPDWLAAILRELDAGADAVGGRILTRAEDRERLSAATRLYLLRDTMYRSLRAEAEALLDPVPYDPWPRHFQHFGANLALTTPIYARAGGVPAVPYLEDQALYDVLERIDARVRHSPAVRVVTSARRASRTAVGFGEFLTHLEEMQGRGTPQLVEDGVAVAAWLCAKRELRQIWRALHAGRALPSARVVTLGDQLGLPNNQLRHLLGESAYFGIALERVRAEAGSGSGLVHPELVEIAEGIRQLREVLAPLRPSVLPQAKTAAERHARSKRSSR